MINIKVFISGIPFFGNFAKHIYHMFITRPKAFPGSENYWEQRYKKGETSGPGSYYFLSEFKANILNDFIHGNNINTVLEFGCGDGNQLKLANYPSYLGFDVSSEAIFRCNNIFINDNNKAFKLMKDYNGETAQLTLSLDVIYHLIEDHNYEHYMETLFNASEKFVIIYSSNTDDNSNNSTFHLKHRKFTNWVEIHKPHYKLIKFIPNIYPYKGDCEKGSFSDFFIFEISR
jgi:SAM-dependent methyltransferase